MENTNQKGEAETFIPDPEKYKQQLTQLKTAAISLFDQMLELDISLEKEREGALSFAKGLHSQLQDLCKDCLGGTLDQKEPEPFENMEIALEELRSHEEEGVIGGDLTYIYMKNPTSYMIGTDEKGIKVIEEGAEIYSGTLPGEEAWLRDIIYISHLNCYLMADESKLYRKDIDEKPPYLLMEVKCGLRVGACFRYSNLHERLVIIKDEKNISTVNLETKEIEIEVVKKFEDSIRDLKLFGEKQDRVVCITYNCHILLYELDFEENEGSAIDHFNLKRVQGRGECGSSIAVCDKGKYVLAEIGAGHPEICCRMVIFEIKDDTLEKKAFINRFSQEIGVKLAIDCYGYADGFVLWAGLSLDDNALIQVYAYDIEKEEFLELESKRVSHQEDYPVKVHQLGDEFYYTGNLAKVMKLSLKIE